MVKTDVNILFVNCWFNMFGKIDCGASNRSTLFVKGLSQIGHVDVISFYPDRIVSNIENCDVVYSKSVDDINKKHNRGWRFICRWTKLLFCPHNMFNYYKINPKKEKIVDTIYCGKKYDIVACRYIENLIECGLLKYADKLVVDVDDNPVNALRRDLSNMYFRHCWNKWEKLIKLRNLEKVVSRILYNVKVSFYSNILESPFSNSIYLHNTTTINERIDDIEESTPQRMLIVGWLDYFPNKNGVIHFVENVFPLIKSAVPFAELHIVGKCSDQGLMNRFNQVEGVKALGFVDDVIEEYRNCRVVIVPVYQGAGTSVKFVEGLMMNRPMVSTPMGVRGFENICKDGLHYMLAKTDTEFANKSIELLNSIEMSHQMSKNAYCVGQANYSQGRFLEIVKETVSNCFSK